MTYQVLARKWRPQDFSAVVGQKPIVTALRNALDDGRIAQAYLFSGIRGVGKTSVARILAKALNCEHGPKADPCNECAVCREITSGDDLDVLEFDAATHSKVDQVRELTESLKYGPARDRYKVIILDEIHRLSRQAFDALLKIVEEPPEHLVFIFATTEAEAVPVTILSRCQEFRFRRVPQGDLVAHLEMLAKEETIDVGPSAVRLIARAGDGSVRDAVALLDQLATFGSGKIADQDAARLLGGLSTEVLLELLAAVLEGRSSDIATAVENIDAQGWDPRHVYGEFLSFCRTGLHLALDGDPERVDLPLEEARELARVAGAAGYENLLRLLHLLLESEAGVRRSESGSLAVEVAWLRGAELPKLVRIEELLGGGTPEGGEKSAPSPSKRPAKPKRNARTAKPKKEKPAATPAVAVSPAKTEQPAPAPEPAPTPEHEPKSELAPTPEPEPKSEPKSEPEPEHGARAEAAPAETASPPDATSRPEPMTAEVEPTPEELGAPVDDPSPTESSAEPAPESKTESDEAPPFSPADGQDPKQAFLELISRRKQSLAAHLSEAQALEVEDGVLKIFTPPGDTWLQTTLARPSNARLLEKSIAAVWGPGVSWRLAAGDPEAVAAREAAEEQQAEDPRVDAALEDPRVQTVLDIFGGSVESVEERGVSE